MTSFVIDASRFDNDAYLATRLAAIPEIDRGSLKSALTYLYHQAGPRNLPPVRFKKAQAYLEPAELKVIKWLKTRTNGRFRKTYGASALFAARASRYRCQECGFADVRALHMDHVSGRVEGTEFACLCANCHNIKSYTDDWNGQKPIR